MSCTPDELKKKINACESNPKSTSKGKTALEACKEMEEKEKTIGDALNAIANTPAKLMDAFKAKNEAVQKTVSDLGITLILNKLLNNQIHIQMKLIKISVIHQ